MIFCSEEVRIFVGAFFIHILQPINKFTTVNCFHVATTHPAKLKNFTQSNLDIFRFFFFKISISEQYQIYNILMRLKIKQTTQTQLSNYAAFTLSYQNKE